MAKGRIFLCVCLISKQYRSVFGRSKTGFHCNKDSFCAEQDGDFEHVPSSNQFCGLYQYIVNREINDSKEMQCCYFLIVFAVTMLYY